MCDVWRYPPQPDKEIGVDIIRKLPRMFFTNVTGGEPFVRPDLHELIAEIRKKTNRIVISTNGFFTERILSLCRRYPDIGIRISIEGCKEANDHIRGIPDGYDRTQMTLKELQAMGIKDIGFAMTVQDANYKDLMFLYKMARSYNYEFATATVHNSHYFHKFDNKILNKDEVISSLQALISEQIRSKRPKEWFRAYFNHGLINYINGRERFLPCEMGKNGFFLDPWGDVLACNGMNEKSPLGNLYDQDWNDIWKSKQAGKVRAAVKKCTKNCWMIGSAAPAIWHHPVKPMQWVIAQKIKNMLQPQPVIEKSP